MNGVLMSLNIVLLGAGCWYAWRTTTSPVKSWFWPVLLLHVLCGFAIGGLYLVHYRVGDTLHYFQEGILLNTFATENLAQYVRFLFTNAAPSEWQQALYYSDVRALFMAKLVSVSTMVSGQNYWISSMHFSLLSFAGVWRWCSVLVRLHPHTKSAALFSFFLLPSVVFWSSGLVKESIAMGCLYFIASVFLQLFYREKVQTAGWLLLLPAAGCLFVLKYYYAALLIPVLLCTYVHRRYFPERLRKNFVIETGSWLVLVAIVTLGFSQLHPNFHPNQFLEVVFDNYRQFLAFSQPGDVMIFPGFSGTWLSVVSLSPWAFISSLFRPFVTEAGNVLQVIASIENLFLLVLALSALRSLIRPRRQSSENLLLVAVLTYCFVLGVFLALSTPNFGTLIRYRVGFLPFFVFLTTLDNPLFQKIGSWLK